ncbi:MAG TPA: host attachment protein [Burkholderiales bacterium]|nr:host attachment protein [Burkholderiales bacterium]
MRSCIIVADARRARFYGIEPSDGESRGTSLVERMVLTNPSPRERGRSVTGRVRTETNTDRQAGPMHPMVAQRERHRVELERRFGQEIARRAGEIVRDWKQGTLVLIAEPRLLGLVREPLRRVLHPGIEVKELAKDYTQLAPAELLEHLAPDSLVPARGASAR